MPIEGVEKKKKNLRCVCSKRLGDRAQWVKGGKKVRVAGGQWSMRQCTEARGRYFIEGVRARNEQATLGQIKAKPNSKGPPLVGGAIIKGSCKLGLYGGCPHSQNRRKEISFERTPPYGLGL